MQNAIELETLTLKDPLGELFNGWAKFQLLPRETLTQKHNVYNLSLLNLCEFCATFTFTKSDIRNKMPTR